MMKKENSSDTNWTNPDDAPRLTKADFEHADVYRGSTLVRRGRPRAESPKEHVSLRLDPDILNHFRSTGKGWQVRLNETLREAAGLALASKR